MVYLIAAFGLTGWILAGWSVWRLHRWESHLFRTRIVIAYKNKVKINSPMIDWLKWAQSLEHDEQVRGHTIYKLGGTTVALLKKLPKDHGKTTTTTIEESPDTRKKVTA